MSPSVKSVAVRTFWLCFLPYGWVAANAWSTFTGYTLSYISGGVALNSALLALACGLAAACAPRLIHRHKVAQAVLATLAAVLITVSFAYSFLVFMQWGRTQKLATLPVVLVIGWIAMWDRQAFRAVVAGLAAAIAVALAQNALPSRTQPSSQAAAPATPIAPSAGQEPNIYLLMFDAMSSSSHYRESFGVAPPWQEALKVKGFRELPGAMSSRPYSMQSVIDVLQGRPMPWSEFGTTPDGETLGLTIDSRSAAIDRAHAAGYRVAFLYQNNYFGRLHPLRHLDAYLPERSVGVCSLAPNRVGFHLCRGTDVWVERLFGETNEVEAHHLETRRFIERVIDERRPWITWSYIAVPEHTSLTYREYSEADRAEFQEEHRVNSARALAIMEDYLQLIRERDPRAVVVVFGDHGLIQSRGWDSDAKVHDLFSADQKTKDERSIGLFVSPAGFCDSRLRDDYSLEHLLTDLIACARPAPSVQAPPAPH
ncbi:hypothetical protein [Roseateles sp.]|uniref:hypothetical protein n=1 Tax=Roseateles sp. TaxID=1971397 RepID=UPI002F416A83